MRKPPEYLQKNCIRCGRCIEVCPMGIVPTDIARAVDSGKIEEFEVLHSLDCMECGSCTFVCPARIPIVQYIKEAKGEVMKRSKIQNSR